MNNANKTPTTFELHNLALAHSRKENAARMAAAAKSDRISVYLYLSAFAGLAIAALTLPF